MTCLSKRRQQHGWTCPRPHGDAVFFFLLNSFGPLPIVETQEYRRNVSGVDRRETGFLSLSGILASLTTAGAHLRVDNERPVPLCVCFLRTRHGVSRPHRARGRRTREGGTGAQCATPHRRPRARLVAGRYTACRVDFVFPRRG